MNEGRIVMNKRMSVLLVLLTIIFSLLGGFIASRLFTPDIAVADEKTQSKILTAEELQIIGKDGKMYAKFGISKFPTGVPVVSLSLYNKEKEAVCLYSTLEKGSLETGLMLHPTFSEPYSMYTNANATFYANADDCLNEKELVYIGTSKKKDTGLVYVKSPNYKGRAEMCADDYGGVFNVFGKVDNTARATMQINEYGNGSIGLWDKDGYRLK